MSATHDPDRPTDDGPPTDPFDAALAAAFGADSAPPRAGSVLEALAASLPEVPHVHLREPATEGVTPVNLPDFPAMPVATAAPPARLQLVGEIARGGMGAVLKGRDTELGRDIAVKVLLETHQGTAELARRFVEEAQIAGQLQHPGIVPVYELGAFADGRPYFTMKLVEGQTLAALLAARRDVAADRPQLLGIFGQVCQTLGYAHSRGVIHRDLKPANVMVGSFGEVQVMDWGLAKVLCEGGATDEAKARQQAEASVIRSARIQKEGTPEVGSHTRAGSVLGTPSYMAPEQARGEVDLVDERADVFGLGAILCEILTGRPPFPGKEAEAQRKAQTAQLEDAYTRLDGCGADGELIAWARRCLAPDPRDRPRHAGEVAEQMTAYQHAVAERLRRAELEQAAAKARAAEAKATAAAERRARQRSVGLAAAVLALMVVSAGGGLWAQWVASEKREAAGRQRQAVEAALEKLPGLLRQWRWQEADTVLGEVDRHLGEAGPADLRGRAVQARADLDLAVRLDAIRLRRATLVAGGLDYQMADRDYAAAFAEVGVAGQGNAEEAAARVRDSAIREQLVAALDDWALAARDEKRRPWLLGVARYADPDDWRNRFRDARVWRAPAALEGLAKELLRDEVKLQAQSPPLLVALGLALVEGKGDAVPLLTEAWRCYPNDFWLSFELGNALCRAKKWREAVGCFRAALALRPATVAVSNNLGVALKEMGQTDEAIREYHRARALDPRCAEVHNSLGAALATKGQLDKAIEEFRTALALDDKHAAAHTNLGSSLKAKGQLDEAIKEHRKAIELDPRLAPAHRNLGSALDHKGLLDEAIQEFRKALAIDANDSTAHNDLGAALRDKGRPDEAIQECRKALEIDPRNARAHYNLGVVFEDKRQPDEAIREYQKAIELDSKHAPSHNNLGKVLRAKGHVDEAMQEFRKAIELDPSLAQPHFNLGNTLAARRHLDEAIREFRASLEIDPKLAVAHVSLGSVLHGKGRVDEAIREWRKAIDLDPTHAPVHAFLAGALEDKGRLDEAIREYRAALAIDPKPYEADYHPAETHYNLGGVLRKKGLLDEAIREFRAAIKQEPAFAEAHCNLGHVLRSQGKFAEALTELRKGHELGAKKLGWRYPSDRWVRDTEGLIELERRLNAILGGKEKSADASERLALARLCQEPFKQFYAASTRFYAEAFDAKPQLADDPGNGVRYNAVCAAALAAAGQGKDAATLDAKERARLRKQALDWLGADLKTWAGKLDGKPAKVVRERAAAALHHWQGDTDLRGVRHPWSLLRLPADERRHWQKLWTDVKSLLQKSGEKDG
jgi:serine/threonine-protein kinase